MQDPFQWKGPPLRCRRLGVSFPGAGHPRSPGRDRGAYVKTVGRKVAQELRQASDCLPERTREAMLEGLDHNEIIVGAYTDRHGRVCPMLAAHRNGGRTSLATFAKAWDRYTGAKKRPRPATDRELRTLRSRPKASLMYGGSELAAAAAEHQALAARRPQTADRRERRDTGERSRLKEL